MGMFCAPEHMWCGDSEPDGAGMIFYGCRVMKNYLINTLERDLPKENG